MSADTPSAEDGVLVGRCYTKARRHPLMIGMWPGGRGAIWGGPYTVPQVIVIAVVFGVLMLTRSVWAHFGLVNLVIAIGVPYGLSLMVRHLHIDGRNPLLAAVSAGGTVVSPAGGRLGGRPVKPLGRRPLVGVCSVTWTRTAAPSREVRRAAEERANPVAISPAEEVASSSGSGAGRQVSAAAGLLALRQERAVQGLRTQGRGCER
ncbi:hypothetical protein [Streptomyces sp. NBC_00233]|uniref:hypothetical protein n=1 Tax=Streptomyces sp. NBC_00233 TaxID=2975686 RepID=UPI00224E14F6|nr:hypothetical protein [Streptomyces sp. NBC_00233]MCX5231463.1 conjugal transfer protein [Streptomyces sp. NBC_00233]MCX5233579.1 conjugal transfer protein [Streptomyces sp. NBC_00233]